MFTLGAVLSLGALTSAQCTGAEDCGPQEGYPYYYDWDFNPSPMIRLTKVAAANVAVPALFYYKYDRIDYETANGVAKDYTDFALTSEDYQSDLTANWYMIAMIAAGLWGTAFVLNSFALIGFMKLGAAFWIKHVISNLNMVAYGYIGYLLWDSDYSFGRIFQYVIAASIMFALERFFGVAAIQHMRPASWVYLDTTLKPSFFFLIGLAEHVYTYPFMEVEWPEQDTLVENLLSVDF